MSEKESSGKDVVDNKDTGNPDQIPAITSENLPEILRALSQIEKTPNIHAVGQRQEIFQGPLPPQLLNKLDKSQCDLLVNDLVESKRRDHDFRMKFLESVNVDRGKRRNQSFYKYCIAAVLSVGLVVFLVLTNNVAIIKEYIPWVMSFLGGSGLVAYNFSKKKNDGKKEIEDVMSVTKEKDEE
jgi:hypothetical protein